MNDPEVINSVGGLIRTVLYAAGVFLTIVLAAVGKLWRENTKLSLKVIDVVRENSTAMSGLQENVKAGTKATEANTEAIKLHTDKFTPILAKVLAPPSHKKKGRRDDRERDRA